MLLTNCCRFVLLLCLLSWVSGATLAQISPQHTHPVPSIDVRHIVLDLQFDWPQKQAFGTATVMLSPLSPTDFVVLDAAFMTLYSVSDVNNKRLKYSYLDGETAQNLTIFLDRTYKAGEELTLEIEYRTRHENRADPNAIGGSFGQGLRFFQPTTTTPTKRKQIWSSGEPESNKYWFPCHEAIADIHTTEVIATVEKPLMVISNGNLIEITDRKNNTQTFHYKSDVAFPNYLVSIVVGEYTPIMQQSGKTIVQSFGYPHEQEAVGATVGLLPDMIQFLEKKTGFPYPFPAYNQVVVQDYPFPGLVGQQSATLLSDNYIDDYGVHKDFKYLWDGVAVQALANQWFGNLVMANSWEHLWLNNAFAQYFAGLYTEKDNCRAEYLLWYFPFERGTFLSDWQSGNKHPIVPPKLNEVAAFTTDSYSKFKGAFVLQMLQHEMGDDLWWAAVRYFVQQNTFKQVSTADFQAAVEKISGQSYQWFFDQWVYKMGLPELEVSTTYHPAKKQLTLSVKQVQTKADNSEYEQTDYFEGKIRIEIADRIETVYLQPQLENTFTFRCDAAPSFVNFNYEQVFLCETNFTKSKEEYIAQLQESKDYTAKQDAVNQLVAMVRDSNASVELVQAVRAALTTEIQSKQYWRWRMNVLWALANMLPQPYDEPMIELLKSTIEQEKSWLKSAAISILGRTADARFADIYIESLSDESDRVINSAAIALGKTKSPKAFDILMNLEHQKSWKNQNRISALNGLQQLGDARAADYALHCIKDKQSPRWYLATPVWDYPFAAVNTLVALGKADLAYPVLFERFKMSLQEDDWNDIFQNVQLLISLGDPRGQAVFEELNIKFKDIAPVLATVAALEEQFKSSIKK
jgi:aminopeptidase N